jgi:ABC-type transport system involved in multi-copper enzyme maturation permease subunit
VTITALTIRQFSRSRSLLVVAVICLIPVLFAVIPHILGDFSIRDLRETVSEIIYLNLFSATLLPLATLVLATAALGDEVEDKTLHYLAMNPMSRFRIVFEKWLAVILVTTVVVWASLLVIWTVASWGNFPELRDILAPMLVSSLVGILGFGSLFLALSLVINRALLFGVFYVFIWETTLARFLPGIRSISISHYTQSTFVRMLDDRRVTIDGPSSAQTIVIALVLVVGLSLALATWRMRTMAID